MNATNARTVKAKMTHIGPSLVKSLMEHGKHDERNEAFFEPPKDGHLYILKDFGDGQKACFFSYVDFDDDSIERLIAKLPDEPGEEFLNMCMDLLEREGIIIGTSKLEGPVPSHVLLPKCYSNYDAGDVGGILEVSLEDNRG